MCSARVHVPVAREFNLQLSVVWVLPLGPVQHLPNLKEPDLGPRSGTVPVTAESHESRHDGTLALAGPLAGTVAQ